MPPAAPPRSWSGFTAAVSRISIPQVYWRLTDNWLELTLRFLAPLHGVRELKDALSRDILHRLDGAHIPIASATFDIVGMPAIRIGEK
jgi:hypothetical protein